MNKEVSDIENVKIGDWITNDKHVHIMEVIDIQGDVVEVKYPHETHFSTTSYVVAKTTKGKLKELGYEVMIVIK